VRRWRSVLGLAVFFFFAVPCFSFQAAEFVTRSRDTLKLRDRPFYFVGANAYYLLEQTARGDSHTVRDLFRTASRLGMTVIRTWGFNDSADSLNPAVIQYRPGAFNERALQALDYVLLQARLHGMRLLIPLVNNWDEYGGMNQYVRWRIAAGTAGAPSSSRYSSSDLQRTVEGGAGRSYRYALSTQFGHDDFYTDPIIKGWFTSYIATLLLRVNVYTGVAYNADPFVFGWELANEPRSSDRSGETVRRWVEEMSAYIKSLDPNHLVGTGEEGFDVSPAGYSTSSYNNQHWLFNGTAGVAFKAHCVMPSIDFGSCHLYPEAWNLSKNAGGVWIRDHAALARAVGKPMILGEFGVREHQAASYESWLTTALYDGAAGALVWQLLEGTRTDRQGYGFRCSDDALVCRRLREAAEQFAQKSLSGSLPLPSTAHLQNIYPHPFNDVATISYALPFEAFVHLAVFDALGRHVTTLVAARQAAGERKELFDATRTASGVYFARLIIGNAPAAAEKLYRETRRIMVIR